MLVRSADSRIFAFGAADGKRRWVYQRAAASLIVRSPVGLTRRTRASAYAGFSGGKLVAIALANGARAGRRPSRCPRARPSSSASPTSSAIRRCRAAKSARAAYQGRVACYDVPNGNQLWSREMSTLTGVSFDARYAFVSDDKGAVHALRPHATAAASGSRTGSRTGSSRCRCRWAPRSRSGDLQGFVHFVARESGAFLARAATDGSPIRAAPLRLPGGFLVQTQNGGLYALALN